MYTMKSEVAEVFNEKVNSLLMNMWNDVTNHFIMFM